MKSAILINGAEKAQFFIFVALLSSIDEKVVSHYVLAPFK